MIYYNQMNTIVLRQSIINLIFLCATLIFEPIHSNAQKGKEIVKLTLKKARATALEKNPEMTAIDMDASINALAINDAKLKKRPQVYTDFNLQRNLIIPVTPVPANAFDPNAPEGKLLPLRFSTNWTSNAGINASFELFNPDKKLAVKEAEIRENITKLNKAELSNQIIFEAGAAYIVALIAAEQLRLAIADTLNKSTILILTQQQFEEGRLLLATLNQVKAGRNNSLNLFDESQTIYLNAKAQLLYAMGFSPEAQVEIEFLDNIETLFDFYQGNLSIDSLNSIALKKELQEDALINEQINTAAKGYLPLVTLRGYYGINYFDNNFNLLKSSNWNGNSFLNLGVKLPITGSLLRQESISKLKFQQEANNLRFINKRNKNLVEYLSAVREAVVIEGKLLRIKENVKLAETNLRIAEQQFVSGRLLIRELNQIQYDYHYEKNNYLRVSYDYILKKMNIEKITKY